MVCCPMDFLIRGISIFPKNCKSLLNNKEASRSNANMNVSFKVFLDRIPAPCFDYLCGICERRGTCKYTHQYLICHDMCNAYKCKMWSLSEQEIQEIKGNRRPFSEKITREIDRMAYVIISAKKPRPKHLCPRFLTGRDCTNVEFPCDICPQYYNMKDLPKCHKCNVFLLGGVSWGLQCGHVFCEVCELTLEVDKNGPLPKAKCCICRWGEAVLMVAMK